MANQAASDPPRCLRDVQIAGARVDRQIFLTFFIACAGCGATSHWVLSHKLIDEDGDYFGPAHAAECSACGIIAPLFDPARQGYDGELGQHFGLVGTLAESQVRSHDLPGPLSIGFAYNIEDDELADIAERTGVRSVDLFDSVSIEVGAQGSLFSIDYECA